MYLLMIKDLPAKEEAWRMDFSFSQIANLQEQ